MTAQEESVMWSVNERGDMSCDLPADTLGDILRVSNTSAGTVWIEDTMNVSQAICVAIATSPTAARQCAIDIVNAIKRARGEDVPTL